jgi:cytochrome b
MSYTGTSTSRSIVTTIAFQLVWGDIGEEAVKLVRYLDRLCHAATDQLGKFLELISEIAPLATLFFM